MSTVLLLCSKYPFLFGAGAEGKGNFEMPTGINYLIKCALDENEGNGIRDALYDFFKKEKHDKDFDYTRHHFSINNLKNSLLSQLLFERLQEDKDFFKKYQDKVGCFLFKNC